MRVWKFSDRQLCGGAVRGPGGGAGSRIPRTVAQDSSARGTDEG